MHGVSNQLFTGTGMYHTDTSRCVKHKNAGTIKGPLLIMGLVHSALHVPGTAGTELIFGMLGIVKNAKGGVEF